VTQIDKNSETNSCKPFDLNPGNLTYSDNLHPCDWVVAGGNRPGVSVGAEEGKASPGVGDAVGGVEAGAAAMGVVPLSGGFENAFLR